MLWVYEIGDSLIRLEIWFRRAKFQSTFPQGKVRRFAANAIGSQGREVHYGKTYYLKAMDL